MKRATPISIPWQPEKDSTVPVYRQIVQYVCGKVARGEWPVGTRLPSQRALAEAFGVNRSTVTTALEELTSYGVVAGRHGAGTQVVSNTWSLLLPQRPDWGKFLSAGFFRENHPAVQTINRLEFVPGITRLGTGELDPRLFPAELWRASAKKAVGEIQSLGYLEPLGLRELREALSAHLADQGISAPPSCILITSGALQGLQLISACLLPRGATVFTEAPTYLKSLQVFQSAGMKLSGMPMDGEGLQYWKLAPALGEARRQGSSILYTIPTNQNPTGITMGERRREDLMKFCVDHRLPVIEDGAYQELCWEGPDPTPLKALDQTGSVLYLGSASKTLAPGLRVGWIVAPEPIVQRLGDVKMQMDYGASSVSQWILAEFLTSGRYRQYLSALKETLKKRRDHALAVLEQACGDLAKWNRPTGGFYIWLTFQREISMEKLFVRAGKEGILLNPGDLYDFAENRSLRLSYAYTSCEEFAAGVGKLMGIVREMV
ncbi:MAG: PLP-dependent aminotransferase family protein [Clostridiales bacterium]|nr:PLP-dependent aminotransferase family protein [Clostridiales bacterium]MDY4173409.1 PLP-dependent aminotransferase family protein [Evtepia sp.]